MTKVTITLNGKDYAVNCEAGQEARLRDIAAFVERKMKKAEEHAGNVTVTEQRLLMLTCIMLADELMDLRRKVAEEGRQTEDLFIAAVEHLKDRVAGIASQVGNA